MTPSPVRLVLVAERTAWVRRLVDGIRHLPLESLETFLGDSRNVAAAESYLRRALEGLLDLGRHILAKGFGTAAAEYKDVGSKLAEHGVLSKEEGLLLRRLAGYRNRLVHFYHEVSSAEFYRLCTEHLEDVTFLLERLLAWVEAHPEKTDRTI